MVEVVKEFNDFTLKKIVKIIDNGGVICFPTETVYALVADASNDEAIKKIYKIKHRTVSKPISVLVGDIYQAKRIVHFNDRASLLALKFFPGPITLVLKPREHHNLSPLINKELGTVGIRMPNHVLSLKIIKAIGRPVVGTSANISGASDDSHDAKDIIDTIGDQIDLIVDHGKAGLGIASTIVDLSEDDEVKILREGAISKDKILDILDMSNIKNEVD
jgi:L-threonylcarbamoyladenylate synthase